MMTSDRPAGPPLAQAPSSPRNLNPAAPVFRHGGQDKGQNLFSSDLVASDKDFCLVEGGAGGEHADSQSLSQADSGSEDRDYAADSSPSVAASPDAQELTGDEQIFSEKLIAPIRKQLEYYFSSENLPNDKYINTHMDINKFVPLELFSNFNRMKPICSSIEQMVQAVEMSSLLELSEDKRKVRISQTRKTLTLRGLPPMATEDDICRVLEENDCPKPFHVEMITLQKAHVSNWYVSFSTESECLDAFFKLHNCKVMVDGYSIGCCIKSSGTLAATGSFPSQEENQQRRISQQAHQSNPVASVSANITQQAPAAVVAAPAGQHPTALMQPFNPMPMHPTLMATTGQGLYYNQNAQYLPFMTGMITQTWPGSAAMEPGLMMQGSGLQPQHIRTQLPRPHVMQNASQSRFLRPQRQNNRPNNIEKGGILDRSHDRSMPGTALPASRSSPRGMDSTNNPNANILSSIPRRSNIRDDVTVTIGGHQASGQQHTLVSAVISQPHTVTVGPVASTTIVNSVLDNSAVSVPPTPVSVPVHNQLIQQQQHHQPHQQQQQVHHPHHPQPLLPSLSGSNQQTSNNQALMTQPHHHSQAAHHQSHPHHHQPPPPPIHHPQPLHSQGQSQHHPHSHNQQQSMSNSQPQQMPSQHQLPPHHHHHHQHQPPMHASSHQQLSLGPSSHHHQHHHSHYQPHHPSPHHGMMPAQHHQPQQQQHLHHHHHHHQMVPPNSHSQPHHHQQAPNFGRPDTGNNRRSKKRRDDTNIRNLRGDRQPANRSNFSSQVPPVPDNFTMEANSFPPLPGALSTPSSESSQESRTMHADIVKGFARAPLVSSNAPPPSATRFTSSSTPSPTPTINPLHIITVGGGLSVTEQHTITTEEVETMTEDDIASLPQEETGVDVAVLEPIATVSRQLHHDLQISSTSESGIMPAVQNRAPKMGSSPASIVPSPTSSVHKNVDPRLMTGNYQIIQQVSRSQQLLPPSAIHQEQQQQHLQHYEHLEGSKDRPSYAQILQNKRDAVDCEMNVALANTVVTNGPSCGASVNAAASLPHQNNYPNANRTNVNINAFREQGNYISNQGSRQMSHRLPKDIGGVTRLDSPQSRMPNGRRNSKENRAQGNNNKLERRRPDGRPK